MAENLRRESLDLNVHQMNQGLNIQSFFPSHTVNSGWIVVLLLFIVMSYMQNCHA